MTRFFPYCATTSRKEYDLFVDTECTAHVLRDRTVFSSFESWNEAKNTIGALSRIESKSSVEEEIRDCHDDVRSCTFHNEIFVPSYSVNLMSLSSAMASGSSFSFALDASRLLSPDGRQLPVKQVFLPWYQFHDEPDAFKGEGEEGYELRKIVVPQTAGQFIAYQSVQARVLRNVYSFQNAWSNSAKKTDSISSVTWWRTMQYWSSRSLSLSM